MVEKTDRDLLRAIVERFDGGPVGLSTWPVAWAGARHDRGRLRAYLLQLGLSNDTPRGRIVTSWAAPTSARRRRNARSLVTVGSDRMSCTTSSFGELRGSRNAGAPALQAAQADIHDVDEAGCDPRACPARRGPLTPGSIRPGTRPGRPRLAQKEFRATALVQYTVVAPRRAGCSGASTCIPRGGRRRVHMWVRGDAWSEGWISCSRRPCAGGSTRRGLRASPVPRSLGGFD